MALSNLTEDLKQTSFQELACSTEFTGEVHNHLLVLLVLSGFVAIIAFLGNTLILVALHKESSLHAPSKLLFRNLATTDLCVGLIAGPLYATYLIFSLSERQNSCRYVLAISAFTGRILCVDRLLALLLQLKYRQVVTLKQIYRIVAVLWVLSTARATMFFLKTPIASWYACIVVALCVVTSIFSYTKIFLTLRHNQIHAHGNVNHGQPSQTVQLNIARYKKTVSSALWVQLALVACYPPSIIMEVLHLKKGVKSEIMVARCYSGTLTLLNSSLNPILYCWKIREVRQAVKDTLSGLFCSSS